MLMKYSVVARALLSYTVSISLVFDAVTCKALTSKYTYIHVCQPKCTHHALAGDADEATLTL